MRAKSDRIEVCGERVLNYLGLSGLGNSSSASSSLRMNGAKPLRTLGPWKVLDVYAHDLTITQ